ncbi:MAG TPA: hypothetical protein HA272_10140 [Methanoregula sp.]|nr:hypothetical protein [Methanoregula sp.]
MTETTTVKSEIGTCVGCRVPCWRETQDGCCQKHAVLVKPGDAGVEIVEILVPARHDEPGQPQKGPEIIIGVWV